MLDPKDPDHFATACGVVCTVKKVLGFPVVLPVDIFCMWFSSVG